MNRAAATVRVECDVCARKFGRVVSFGEMILWPESEGGGWRWVPIRRQVDWPGQRRPMRYAAEGKRGGGVEPVCRRCGHSPRLAVAWLAKRAAQCMASGVHSMTA